MNRHTRRALALQNARRISATAAEQIEALCPPGWAVEMVTPPWAGDRTSTCRSCGTASSGKWAMAILTAPDAAAEVLRFCFVTLCAACAVSPETKDKLTARAFPPPPTTETP